MTRGFRDALRPFAPAVAAALALLSASASAAPRRTVLVAGDSMMKATAGALARRFATDPGVEIVQQVRIGSGLARLDLYDWHDTFRKAVALKPEVALVWFGGNDAQPMKTAAGVVEVGSPAWSEEYGRRVTQTIQILKGIGVRQIIWIGMPDMRDTPLQLCATAVNLIVKERTAGVEGVTYFETVPIFSITPGQYSPYVLGPKALPIVVRSSDGGHLNPAGAERLVERLMEPLGKALGLPAKAP